MASKFLFMLLLSVLNNGYIFAEKVNKDRAIINGIPAKLKQFPFMVFLENKCEPPEEHTGWYCTGSLVTDQWVLTAAHCYREFLKMGIDIARVITEVRAGTIDRSRKTKHTQDRISKHHVLHEESPNFKLDQAYNNDIAVLKVTEKFKLNAYVNTIATARHPRPYGRRTTCTVMGFGRAFFSEDPDARSNNTKLLYAKAKLDEDKFGCRKRAEEKGVDADGLEDWTEKHLCLETLDYRQSVCSGDSGGPVVCEGLHTGVSVARGSMHILAPSICGVQGIYHIYTFTGMYEKWLRKLIPDLRPSKLIVGDKIADKHASEGGGVSRRATSGGLLLVGGVLCYFRSL